MRLVKIKTEETASNTMGLAKNGQSRHANAVNNTNAIMEPSKEQRVSIIKKQFYKWKFGSINIRSGKEKERGAEMYIIAREVDRADLQFCCIQEVRHRNTGKKIMRLNNGNKYAFLWSGTKKRRDAGVGFLIKVDSKIEYSDPEINSPRVIAINMNIHGF